MGKKIIIRDKSWKMIEANTELKNRLKKVKFKKLKSKKDTSRFQLFNADSMDQLEKLTPNSIDAMVTDPPAGISFMNMDFDHDKGGRDMWISWLRQIMHRAYGALKPGAHILVWALPRTSHWTATAIEDAGFEIRDVVTHCFGSGFPKSLDISKGIDKKFGAERKTIGEGNKGPNIRGNRYNSVHGQGAEQFYKTESATEEAKQYNGYGTALKPAYENWILARKRPEGTVVDNVLKHRTGGLNIDGCRIGTEKVERGRGNREARDTGIYGKYEGQDEAQYQSGRFPSNFILTHSPNCKRIGEKKVKSSQLLTTHQLNESENLAMSGKNYKRNPRQDWGKDGTEIVDNYNCDKNCPIFLLDQQSGESKSPSQTKNYGKHSDRIEPGNNGTMNSGWDGDKVVQGHSDTGGASRYFKTFEPDIKTPFVYIPKPSTSERNAGLSGEPEKVKDGRETDIDNAFQRGETLRKNVHPTVKSVRLMRYLVRLITPPNGIVLDPFTGSGSTGIAAMKEGMRFIGIEKEEKYFKIAKNRISDATL